LIALQERILVTTTILSIIITVEVKLAEAHLGSCNGYESVNPRKEQS